jgi:hypothetical protein
MKYEMPSMLTVGAVEAVTFGGYLYPVAIDHITGYIGFRQIPMP